jgi:hypothetical protein
MSALSRANRGFQAWIHRPAQWWQFWRPQSASPGGMIMALLLVVAGALVLVLSR